MIMTTIIQRQKHVGIDPGRKKFYVVHFHTHLLHDENEIISVYIATFKFVRSLATAIQ